MARQFTVQIDDGPETNRTYPGFDRNFERPAEWLGVIRGEGGELEVFALDGLNSMASLRNYIEEQMPQIGHSKICVYRMQVAS